jgi:hypothetical protein
MTKVLTNLCIFIPTMCSRIGLFLVNIDSHPKSIVHWTSSSKIQQGNQFSNKSTSYVKNEGLLGELISEINFISLVSCLILHIQHNRVNILCSMNWSMLQISTFLFLVSIWNRFTFLGRNLSHVQDSKFMQYTTHDK